MVWTIEVIRSAENDLARIDRLWRRRILEHLRDDIAPMANPRERGKALTGDLAGLWRYRVGDYRVVCDIQDRIRVISVVRVAHRSRVYD